MNVTVHHLDNSRSQRILWFLEELGHPYELREWKRGPDMRAPRELKAIHPLGLAPIVDVDGRIYVESGAILENLIDRLGQGRLRPTDLDDLEAWRFWMHYAEGSVMPPLLIKLITGKLRTNVPFFVKPLTATVGKTIDAQFTDGQIARHLDFIDAHLGQHDWLCTDFSAADIQMAFPLLASQKRTGPGYRHIAAWLGRCQQRPAFARALKKGGPLRF